MARFMIMRQEKEIAMGRKKFIDLSISIEPNLPSDPEMMAPKIDYIDHRGTLSN